MTTNREWLYSLDVADLADWFDSEHDSTLDGDTAEENADSRELLDADVRKWCGKYAYQADMVWTWLNRQAAITKREYGERMVSEAMCSRICVVVSEQREQIAELTAELETARRDRETYRELLGKAIDFAYAITLLVDEGAA